MWPFKKRAPEVPFAEFVATLDPAPCGEQETHYQWKLGSNLPCPACTAIRTEKRKDAELDALADKIVAKLRTPGVRARDPACSGNDSESHCVRTDGPYCGVTNPYRTPGVQGAATAETLRDALWERQRRRPVQSDDYNTGYHDALSDFAHALAADGVQASTTSDEAQPDYLGMPFAEARRIILDMDAESARGLAISFLIQNGLLRKNAAGVKEVGRG